MNSFLFHTGALFYLTIHMGFAAVYTAPNGTKELFQLEKIPLQVSSMKEISKQLVVLTHREHDGSDVQQRANAQLLALAMQLDPTNQEARDVNRLLSKGQTLKLASEDQVLKAKSKLRVYKKWLSSTEAGDQANLLAGYLTDATKTFNSTTINNKDTANWSGVIRPIAPRPAPDPMPKEVVKEADTTEKKGEAESDPLPQPSTTDPKFHLTALSVKSPLTTEKKEKYKDPKQYDKELHRTIVKHAICSIGLKIKPRKQEGESEKSNIKFTFPPGLPWISGEGSREARDEKLAAPVVSFLKEKHKGFPSSSAVISIKNGTYASSNELAITAPVALMLEASLQNKPLRDDIHICAAIGKNGAVIPPKNFWAMIKILRASESGGRLIVSSQSAALLTQLLVYGEPQFFTQWEVYVVDTLAQAVEVAAEASPSNHTQAHELFQSIQELTKKSDVTKLAVNRAVRKRLAEIYKLAPNHLSSKVLLIQGGGKRPMRLSEESLAHALLPVIYKIDEKLFSMASGTLPKAAILKLDHEEMRATLDPMDRILNRSNDELYTKTMELTNGFRRLATLSRRMASGDFAKSTAHTKTAAALVFDMQTECNTLKEKMEKIIQKVQGE